MRNLPRLRKIIRFRNLPRIWRDRHGVVVAALVFGAILIAVAGISGQQIPFLKFIPNGFIFLNPNGASQTHSTNSGGIDLTGPFFQSLGTNGRSCGTCHASSNGMSVSATDVELHFRLTQGTDPIFRPVDGSNCDHGIDLSTFQG